jgi:benzoyl-CoA reductase subunit BamC
MKAIVIDCKKCSGCKLCEVACSLRHTKSIELEASRIRVFISEEICIPVIAGSSIEIPCKSNIAIKINNEKINGCILCRISCPNKSIFKEPETHELLQCDFCGECVQWCSSGALTF